MAEQVDSQSVELDDNETKSITLRWDTENPDDIGEYTATAATEDDADTTSVSVENVRYHRFVEAVSPGGAASASRAGVSDRSAVTSGRGAASVTRAVTAGRSLAATSHRGVGTTTRSSMTDRVATAISEGGSASIVRTLTVSPRRVDGAGSGGAAVMRVSSLQRDVNAASAGGLGATSRFGVMGRAVVAAGRGAASVSRAIRTDRTTAALSQRASGSVSRTNVTGRVTTAVSPGGSVSSVRTVTVSSRGVGASGTGAGFVTRVGVLQRDADAASVGGVASVTRALTYHRFLEAVSPGGAASASRAGVSDRSVVASGTGTASVSRAVAAGRSLGVASQRGAGSVSRTSVTDRVTTAVSAGGSASIVRTVTELSRDVDASGSGVVSVTRVGVLQRDVHPASPGGTGSVTRVTTAVRFVTAVSPGGGAVVSWSSPSSWQLPASDTETNRRILFRDARVQTDHDQITLTAEISTAKLDALDHYREAGDVDREQTAFGAYRRLPRDGSDPVTVTPPDALTPPFEASRVVPTGYSADEVAPRRHQVDLTLGLEDPRARQPLETLDESLTVDRREMTVDSGEVSTTTLQWTPDGSQIGDWLATVNSEDDSDSQLVTVSDAPWTLSWPVATLSLTERQVGQLSRSQMSSVPSVQLPLRLDDQQAAILLAVGSRVDAADVRFVPDSGNRVVDTLPEEELTAGLSTPADSDLDDGTVILADWNLELARPAPPRWNATVEIVRTD